MNNKQVALLDFMKKFNRICVDNDIEYFADGGTALGAIRHKGFLPWDDDVDLCMKRDEWLRVKPVLKKVLGNDWVIVDNDEFAEYNNPIVRIVDIKTAEFTRSRLTDDTPHGIQLEIFLLDPIPEDEIGYGKYYSDFWLYCESLTQNYIVATNTLNLERLSIETYLKNKKLVQRENTAKQLETKLFGYSEDECDYYHCRWGMQWLVYSKRIFEKQIWVDFEDMKVPVACGFADYFFTNFGDTWMMIPEEGNREVHNTVANLNVPYAEYDKILSGLIDYKATSLSRISLKRSNVIKAFNEDKIRRAYLYYDNMKLDFHYAPGCQLRERVMQALEEKDYDSADDALQLLFEQQQKCFERYMLATTDLELLYALLEVKFVKGNWRFIEKVRQIILNKPELITEKMAELFSTAIKAREAYFSQFYGTYSEYKNVVQDILAQYPQQTNMTELNYIIKSFDDENDKNECLTELESLNDEFQANPTIIMLRIYCMMKLGRKGEAESIYDEVKQHIRNGMVLIKLKEIMGY